jgi:protein subunit release factor A
MNRVIVVVFNERSQAFNGLDALRLLRHKARDCRQEREEKEEPLNLHEHRSA